MKYYIELPEVWITEFLENDPLCDGYWISSLTQSWQKGYPDNCTLPWTNYVDLVRRVRLHSDKKIIVDVDMLYNEPSIAATVAKELFHVGCNTIVVESKRFPKVNSLTPDKMLLSTPEEFSRLLNKVKMAVPELEVIARNEYLAKTKDADVTYQIAKRAINAGADGVVVHWGGDSDTRLLKETLHKLKEDNILTGIIPTKYLNQVNAGDFDEIADFSILGNICSSYIRQAFSQHSVRSLLDTPCMFGSILDRVNSHEPKGQTTLVVLGAKKNRQGEFLLENKKIVDKFLARLDDFYNVVFVVDENTKINIQEDKRVYIARVEESLGEVHSLFAARELLNTENVTVAYADIDALAWEHLHDYGMLFHEDAYIGVMNVEADALMQMFELVDSTSSILNMGIESQLKFTLL
jgi:hypothetical protein